MAPITRANFTPSVLSPVRAVQSTLDPLLFVLAVIRRANNGEVGLRDDRAEREILSSIRSAAYSIRSILSDRPTGLGSELTAKYSTAILDAVEGAVKVDDCEPVREEVITCVSGKTEACFFQVHPFFPPYKVHTRRAECNLFGQVLFQ